MKKSKYDRARDERIKRALKRIKANKKDMARYMASAILHGVYFGAHSEQVAVFIGRSMGDSGPFEYVFHAKLPDGSFMSSVRPTGRSALNKNLKEFGFALHE